MKLLAIDTASVLCAACVFDTAERKALSRVSHEIGKGHAERLMDILAEVLDGACTDYAGLDAIAVSIGPGSFMGIRTGVAAARGLALALDIPATGVTTLEALATEARLLHPGQAVLSAIDAGRSELYAALYAPDGRVLREPAALAPGDAADWADSDTILAGSGALLVEAAAGRGKVSAILGATADIVAFAQVAAKREGFGPKPVPLYLRAPDARPQTGFALPRRGA